MTLVAVPTIKYTADRYDHLRLLAIAAYAAYRNSNVGNAAPAVRKYWERATNVQPGDVVLETSTVWRWARFAVDERRTEHPVPGRHAEIEPRRAQYPEIGVLLRVVQEPMHPDAEDEEDRAIMETVYYVQPLDGSVPEFRWVNARFIRVPDSLEDAF